MLLLTGWTDYAFSSDNVAASQAAWRCQPPSLQVQGRSGRVADGRSRRSAFPSAGRRRSPSTSRAPSSRRARSPDRRRTCASTGIRSRRAARAGRHAAGRASTCARCACRRRRPLRWRGFSAETTPGRPGALRLRLSRVSPSDPVEGPAGRYTREGDVRAARPRRRRHVRDVASRRRNRPVVRRSRAAAARPRAGRGRSCSTPTATARRWTRAPPARTRSRRCRSGR